MTDLHTAIEDLRAALIDEDAGNGHVRDCAFEVVDAHARAVAAWAAKLGLRVEHELHGVTAGAARYTVFRGGQWLFHGTEAETHAYLDGYRAALALRGCP